MSMIVGAGALGALSVSSADEANQDPLLDPAAYVTACLDTTSSYWRGRASIGTQWPAREIRVVGDGSGNVVGERTEQAVGLRAPDGAMLVRGRFSVAAVFADGLSDGELRRLGDCDRSVRPLDGAAKRLSSFPQRRSGRALEQIDAEPVRLERTGRAMGVSVPSPSLRSEASLMRAGRQWRSADSSGLYLAEWIAVRQTAPVRIRLCKSTRYRVGRRMVGHRRFVNTLRAARTHSVRIAWSVRQPSSANATLGRCPRQVTGR